MTSSATKGKKKDIYGQVHPVETPERIAEARKQFEEELLNLSEVQAKWLRVAQEKCPELLSDEFKLLFLRAEVFNADLAAVRFAKYWESRVLICGEEKAFLPFTLDGALKDDELTLRTGAFQFLDGAKDYQGRALYLFYPSKLIDENIHTNEAITRVGWYFAHAAIESESAQKYGVVFLICPGGLRFGQNNRPLEKLLVGSQGVFPLRVSGVHICRSPSFFKWIIWPIFQMFMPRRILKRFMFHWGDDEQMIKRLNRYGIDEEYLPEYLGGSFQHDHDAWLDNRRALGK